MKTRVHSPSPYTRYGTTNRWTLSFPLSGGETEVPVTCLTLMAPSQLELFTLSRFVFVLVSCLTLLASGPEIEKLVSAGRVALPLPF
jgi:hypothetical protein